MDTFSNSRAISEPAPLAGVPIRVGVIGCGGRLRAIVGELLKTSAAMEGRVEITALADPSPEATERMRAELAPAAAVYPDLDTMLAGSALDWVMVGSWNNAHAEQVIAALRAGKRVFCEKPLATSLADCLRMRDALRVAEAADAVPGRRFFFGLVLRYAGIYRRMKSLLEKGVIGKLVSFEFNETLTFNHGGYIHGNWRRRRENAGTHLLEKCCHDFDVVNWLTGSLPVRAASFGGKDVFNPENRVLAERLGTDKEGRAAYSTWPDPARVDPFSDGASIVDNQVVILEYANGARATFHTNCNAAIPERRIYMLGTEGALRADAITGRIELCRIGFDTRPEIIEPVDGGEAHYGGDRHMAAHLADSMIEGRAPLATLEDGLRAAVSCFGVDRALDTGRIVEFGELWEEAGIALACDRDQPSRHHHHQECVAAACSAWSSAGR